MAKATSIKRRIELGIKYSLIFTKKTDEQKLFQVNKGIECKILIRSKLISASECWEIKKKR